MELIEVKVGDLSGAALDWAVAQVEKVQTTYRYGRELVADHDRSGIKLILSIRPIYSPSTDWSQGGPLIDKYFIEFEWITDLSLRAELPACGSFGHGRTHLIAACRAIVASVLGPVVSVPKELCHE